MKYSEHEKWLKTRKKWFRNNPPNHQGYYACSYCFRWIPAKQTTLDHKVSRSNAPHLKHDLSNLTPACFKCNAEKGSLSAEQYKKLKKERYNNKLKKVKYDKRIEEVERDNDS